MSSAQALELAKIAKVLCTLLALSRDKVAACIDVKRTYVLGPVEFRHVIALIPNHERRAVERALATLRDVA